MIHVYPKADCLERKYTAFCQKRISLNVKEIFFVVVVLFEDIIY